MWNCARFGAATHAPTPWLHAENDGRFRPGLGGQMRAAFAGSGGRAQLAMLPPFKGDGYTLSLARGGKQLLLPGLDGFLRANGLPTWDEAAFAPVLAGLDFTLAAESFRPLVQASPQPAPARDPGVLPTGRAGRQSDPRHRKETADERR